MTISRPDDTVSSVDASPIWDRLQLLRRHLGLDTDVELVRALGISSAALRKWRRGEMAPFRSTLTKIAARTGVRLEWLETGRGEMMEAAEVAPPKATEAPPAASLADAVRTRRLQDMVALEDLVVAYEAAQRQFLARGVATPEPRKLLALTLAFYDAAMQALAQSATPEDDPS